MLPVRQAKQELQAAMSASVVAWASTNSGRTTSRTCSSRFGSFSRPRESVAGCKDSVRDAGGGVVTSSSPAAKYPDTGLRDACDRRLSGE